jgi:hypothetical protein
MKKLTHRTYLALPEDDVRREAGRPFGDGVGDPSIKVELVLGCQETVGEALRQAL